MIKRIIFIAGIILLALWQLSFLDSFDWMRSYTHLVLLSAILMTVLSGYRAGLLFAIIAGLILDTYSPLNFGIVTISMLVPIGLCYLLLRKLFARKTIYAILLLVIAGTVSYHVCLWLISNIMFVLNWGNFRVPFSYQLIQMVAIQTIMHGMIAIAAYLIIRLLNRTVRTRLAMAEHV